MTFSVRNIKTIAWQVQKDRKKKNGTIGKEERNMHTKGENTKMYWEQNWTKQLDN